MIKVQKKSIFACYFPQLTALVHIPAYTRNTFTFANYLSFDKENSTFSLSVISNSLLHATIFRVSRSNPLWGGGGRARPEKAVHLTAVPMSMNLLRKWALDSTLYSHLLANFKGLLREVNRARLSFSMPLNRACLCSIHVFQRRDSYQLQCSRPPNSMFLTLLLTFFDCRYCVISRSSVKELKNVWWPNARNE